MNFIAANPTPHASSKKDLRTSSRSEFVLDVLVRRMRFPQEQSMEVGNLSAGGLFIKLKDHSIDLGEHLSLEFQSPEGSTIQLIGKVVWSNVRPSEVRWAVNRGLGVRFCTLDPSAEASIQRLLATR